MICAKVEGVAQSTIPTGIHITFCALRSDQFVGDTLLDEDIDSNVTRVEAPLDFFVAE